MTTLTVSSPTETRTITNPTPAEVENEIHTGFRLAYRKVFGPTSFTAKWFNNKTQTTVTVTRN